MAETLDTTSASPPPLWTIVIPAYNCAALLAECLESVMPQVRDRTDVELIVVDDGSDDHPERVAESIGGDRVRFVRFDQPSGAVASFNNCVELANGHLVHLLHADDTVSDGFYRELERIFDTTDALAAFCRTDYVGADGGYRSTPRERPTKDGIWVGALNSLATANRIQTPGIVVRRSTYDDIGVFRVDLPHTADWEMWSRIAAHGPIGYTPQRLAQYRVHGASDTATRTRSGESIAERLTTMRIVQGYLPADERRGAVRRGLLLTTVFSLRLTWRSIRSRDRHAAANQWRYATRCLWWAATRSTLPTDDSIQSLVGSVE